MEELVESEMGTWGRGEVKEEVLFLVSSEDFLS